MIKPINGLHMPNQNGSHIHSKKLVIFWGSIISASIGSSSAENFGRVVRFAANCSCRVRNCCDF
jgi:hypothetical protein